MLSTAASGWFDLRRRRRSPDGDARRSNVIALAGRIPPKAKSSGYSGERLARPKNFADQGRQGHQLGFCSACGYLASQSTICAEPMKRFGECGLMVPAVTPGRSARRALATPGENETRLHRGFLAAIIHSRMNLALAITPSGTGRLADSHPQKVGIESGLVQFQKALFSSCTGPPFP